MEIATYATLSKEVDLGNGHYLTVQPTNRPNRVFVKVTAQPSSKAHVRHRHVARKRIDTGGGER